VGSFMAYTEGFKGGIDVAASKGVIVTSPNTGGGPHIKTFDSAGIMQSEFLAYADEHRGGVRVSVSNSQIITAPLLGGPDFRKFDLSGNKLDSGTGFEIWWPGSWDVATYHDITYVSTGPNTKRRTSVRELDFGFAGRHWFENVDAN